MEGKEEEKRRECTLEPIIPLNEFLASQMQQKPPLSQKQTCEMEPGSEPPTHHVSKPHVSNRMEEKLE